MGDMKITVEYKAPPREGTGYSLIVPSEIIAELAFGKITKEEFVDECIKAIRDFRTVRSGMK